MKLLKLEVDNRWESGKLNDIKVSFGESQERAQTVIIPANPELLSRVLEVLLPEITNSISELFESLTGSEEEELDPRPEKTQEPFLGIDDGDLTPLHPIDGEGNE